MTSSTYDVYLGIYSGMPRDHHAIWIDTNIKKTLPNGETISAGEIIQVTGNIQQGMIFQMKDGVDPVQSNEGKEKVKIGVVQVKDLERLRQICRSLPPPAKQYDGPRKIDPSKPLYRCQDWTREVIQQLRNAGVLQSTP